MSTRLPRLCALALVFALLGAALGCVSRNVETISSEEAATLSPPTEAVQPGAMEDSLAELPGIAGTVRVEAGVTAPPQGVLFLILRVAGRDGGPPLAVKQLPGDLPASFRISEADAMIPGTPLVGDLDVIARLDQDANAFSREPGDLEGRVGSVAVGETVEIVLLPAASGDSGPAGS